MITLRRSCLALGVLFISLNSVSAQSLADLASKEKEKRGQNNAPRRVYTNEDLRKYEDSRAELTTSPAPETAPNESRTTARLSLTADDSDERLWSKRFIEARGRVQETKAQGETLQAKLNDLNLKLLRQSDVYDRENVYAPLIAQTREQLEKNKADAAAAEQALDDLREELRKSGQPAGWENSQAALKPDPAERQPEEPKTKDQQYWQERLATIDKRYNALLAPLETERFQLINRRDPKEGESTAATGSLGLGVPPRVIDIDVQTKELKQKREEEKEKLIEQAIREGALPGWFR
jgi:hypothetical protein